MHSVFEIGRRHGLVPDQPGQARRPARRSRRPRRGSSSSTSPNSRSCSPRPIPTTRLGDRADALPDRRDDRAAPGRAARAALARRRPRRAQGPRRLALRARRVRRPQVRGLGALGPARRARRRGACGTPRALAYTTDGELVFCHPETGKPLDRSKLVRRFKQATRARRSPRRSPSTSCATRSAPGWPRPACRCARSSTGWATPTPRPRRSTRITSRPRTRQRS